MAQPQLTPAVIFSTNQAEQLALWNALLGTVDHFFGGFRALFAGIHDPRHPPERSRRATSPTRCPPS